MSDCFFKSWSEAYLAEQPPRTKSLVMTLFGDVIRPHGGALWLGSLIRLLAPFGINDRLVRTSVYRLAEEGWLSAQREGRRSMYTLRPQASQRFQKAHQRIYTPTNLAWDGEWTQVFFLSGSISTKQRADLRKALLWEGFGALSPFAFIHPNPDLNALNALIAENHCAQAVYVVQQNSTDINHTRPLSSLITECWQLDEVSQRYTRFIEHFAPVLRHLTTHPKPSAEQAFVMRTLLIHEYRRAQLHDPQLPLELLPKNWSGKKAYEICHQLYQLLLPCSQDYILATLRTEDENAPEADQYFYERFGGLSKTATDGMLEQAS